MKFYDFTAKKINGEEVKMLDYKGKVVLIVNTASKCGFTPQLEELEQLYEKYSKDGFEVLGFPCNQFAGQEPGTNEEVQQFCQINYGVSFTMFEKIDVNGENAHPLYQYLTKEAKGSINNKIKWNFTKFLIDSEGDVVKRYAPIVKPLKIEEDIKKLLKKEIRI
ncbi:glutathione peroxidase [Clostridium aminobutyricum]|uniref:Glutathione peroxidase n=1 Tax=Clostridium aminobutyricum TaxID=33953 RepID=A0A939D960_CLOAM|nr:glutathione peroxidase [Clostridium aminobutyricum]MBN7773451.1 glutathione peroxidase [Clostridium aminobutyricum]